MAPGLISLVLFTGCTELSDGATKQVFVDAALVLDRVPEGEARDAILELTDAGWLSAGEIGIAQATRFKSELELAVVDQALSPAEVDELRQLGATFGTAALATRKGELLEKRQAEAERRKIRQAAAATIRIDGSDVWPAPGPLSERGETVGWTPQDCRRQQESGYQTQTCRFVDADELVEVGFTVFADKADARLAATAAPWERGAVAFRRGRKVLKVRTTDRAVAETVVRAVLTEEVRKAPVPLTTFQRSLTTLGFAVDACREDQDAFVHDLSCDIRSADAGGYAQVQWRKAQPIRPDVGPLRYEAHEAKADLEGLRVRAQVHTTTASASRLATFRDTPLPSGAP